MFLLSFPSGRKSLCACKGKGVSHMQEKEIQEKEEIQEKLRRQEEEEIIRRFLHIAQEKYGPDIFVLPRRTEQFFRKPPLL